MKVSRTVLFSLIAFSLVAAGAFAAGDAAKGKALFTDKKFAGGSKACSDCHPNGRGVEKASEKKEFKLMGKTAKSLEEVVNICIEGGNKGKAIDVKSQQMQDMVAYIVSLKGAAPAKKPAGGY